MLYLSTQSPCPQVVVYVLVRLSPPNDFLRCCPFYAPVFQNTWCANSVENDCLISGENAENCILVEEGCHPLKPRRGSLLNINR